MRILPSLAVPLVILLVACSVPVDPEPGRPESPAATATPAPAGFSVASALAQLPEPTVGRQLLITAGDVRAAAEANGVDLGPDEVDLARLTGEASQTTVLLPAPDLLTAPGTQLGAVLGQWYRHQWFAAVAAAPDEFVYLEGGPLTLPTEAVDLGDGLRSLGEGEDYATNLAQRGFDVMGRPLRVAADDAGLSLSLSTDMVRHWRSGAGERLSSRQGLADIAAALDSAGVVSAALEPGEDGASVGIGWLADGTATIAYDAELDEAALAGLSEGFATDELPMSLISVESGDGVTVARLDHEGRPGVPLAALVRRELPRP